MIFTTNVREDKLAYLMYKRLNVYSNGKQRVIYFESRIEFSNYLQVRLKLLHARWRGVGVKMGVPLAKPEESKGGLPRESRGGGKS